jgi:protein subunit release factor A
MIRTVEIRAGEGGADSRIFVAQLAESGHARWTSIYYSRT